MRASTQKSQALDESITGSREGQRFNANASARNATRGGAFVFVKVQL